MNKKISIIVPVFNAEKHIRVCIESLINQNYPKNCYEIILVDNGSTDGTKDIMDIYKDKIKIFYEQKRGSYAARNTGMRNADGDIIAFTDSDCTASKDWLKELNDVFSEDVEHGDIGCIVGDIHSHPGETLIETYSKNRDIISQKCSLNFLPYGLTANVAFKKDVFDVIGCFDENFTSGGDADISWRMQLSTMYKLIYSSKAIVIHHHRTTLKNLFIQHFKYGIGSVLLHKKYRSKMNYDTRKSLSNWLKLLVVECYGAAKKIIQHPSKYYIFEPLLSFTCMAGYRTGKLYAAIKF